MELFHQMGFQWLFKGKVCGKQAGKEKTDERAKRTIVSSEVVSNFEVEKQPAAPREHVLSFNSPMHYLTELSGKLVAAYQDRENLSLWVSPQQEQGNQQVLVAALRAVLEQEVANCHLRYVCFHWEKDEAGTPLLKVS